MYVGQVRPQSRHEYDLHTYTVMKCVVEDINKFIDIYKNNIYLKLHIKCQK